MFKQSIGGNMDSRAEHTTLIFFKRGTRSQEGGTQVQQGGGGGTDL